MCVCVRVCACMCVCVCVCRPPLCVERKRRCLGRRRIFVSLYPYLFSLSFSSDWSALFSRTNGALFPFQQCNESAFGLLRERERRRKRKKRRRKALKGDDELALLLRRLTYHTHTAYTYTHTHTHTHTRTHTHTYTQRLSLPPFSPRATHQRRKGRLRNPPPSLSLCCPLVRPSASTPARFSLSLSLFAADKELSASPAAASDADDDAASDSSHGSGEGRNNDAATVYTIGSTGQPVKKVRLCSSARRRPAAGGGLRLQRGLAGGC